MHTWIKAVWLNGRKRLYGKNVFGDCIIAPFTLVASGCGRLMEAANESGTPGSGLLPDAAGTESYEEMQVPASCQCNSSSLIRPCFSNIFMASFLLFASGTIQ